MITPQSPSLKAKMAQIYDHISQMELLAASPSQEDRPALLELLKTDLLFGRRLDDAQEAYNFISSKGLTPRLQENVRNFKQAIEEHVGKVDAALANPNSVTPEELSSLTKMEKVLSTLLVLNNKWYIATDAMEKGLKDGIADDLSHFIGNRTLKVERVLAKVQDKLKELSPEGNPPLR